MSHTAHQTTDLRIKHGDEHGIQLKMLIIQFLRDFQGENNLWPQAHRTGRRNRWPNFLPALADTHSLVPNDLAYCHSLTNLATNILLLSWPIGIRPDVVCAGHSGRWVEGCGGLGLQSPYSQTAARQHPHFHQTFFRQYVITQTMKVPTVEEFKKIVG